MIILQLLFTGKRNSSSFFPFPNQAQIEKKTWSLNPFQFSLTPNSFFKKRNSRSFDLYLNLYEMFQTCEKKCFVKHPFNASQFPPFPTNNFEEQSPIGTEAIVNHFMVSMCSF